MRSVGAADSDDLIDRCQGQAYPGLRVPQDLPPSLSQHVILVTKQEDIFKDFQARRELNFRLLIRRFIYQILYGCGNSLCTTATCLSYQKRTTKTPLRRFTRLSARTLACHLASEPNPEASLCPYCPPVYCDYEPVTAVRRRTRRKSNNVIFEAEGKPRSRAATAQGSVENGHSLGRGAQKSKPGMLRRSSRDAAEFEGAYRHTNGKAGQGEKHKLEAHNAVEDEPIRDPKSFTQSLFDTLPLRMLEWLPLPSLRANGTAVSSHGRKCRKSTTSEDVDGGSADSQSENPDDHVYQNDRSPLPPSQGSFVRMRKPSNSDAGEMWRLESEGKRKSTAVEPMAKTGEGDGRDSDHTPPNSVSISSSDGFPLSTEPWPPSSTGSKDSTAQDEKFSADKKQPPSGSDHQGASINGGVNGVEQDRLHGILREEPHLTKTTPAYTLGRISGKTMRKLLSIQAEVEKRCYGSQLPGHTSRISWLKAGEDPTLMFSDWAEFVQQSCFYVLRDSFRLAHAFDWSQGPGEKLDPAVWPTSIQADRGTRIFAGLYNLRPSYEILQSLSYSLEQISLGTLEQLRPYRMQMQRDEIKRRSPSGRQPLDQHLPILNDHQAAFVLAVIWYALSSRTVIGTRCSEPDDVQTCWKTFCRLRSSGRVLPVDIMRQTEETPQCQLDLLKDLVDVFEDEVALELVSKLAKTVSNRVAFSEVSKSIDRRHGSRERGRKRQSVLHLLMGYFRDFAKCGLWSSKYPSSLPLPCTSLEWLRTIALRDWDGQAVVRRAGSVGSSLQMLAAMYEERSDLGLDAEAFHTPFFVERLDAMEMPVEWLVYESDKKSLHILSYSFLFPPAALVTYFRVLNFAIMSQCFENALVTARHVSQFAYSDYIQVANDVELLAAMRPGMANYLVLNVRRDRVLTDAMNQLWRRRKMELMVPLKVRMGMDEGEEGIDHGGVQQEFFRCLLIEALDPAYGIFTVDEATKMTWFRPGSLEPLYKFEMLGMLFSIAIYNSITLPITFPLAFYRKLLGLPVKKLSHIEDGWPDLAKGFRALLDWSEGDVADVFMRTYEFSYDAYGERVNIDMQKILRHDPWPAVEGSAPEGSTPKLTGTAGHSRKQRVEQARARGQGAQTAEARPASSTSSAALVTNTNRSEYVKDYIHWLSSKSVSRQFDAFWTGFQTCLPSKSLSIFTPAALQSVIEGFQCINTVELESVTRYEDGYHPQHPTIRHFWTVVHAFPDDRKRGLLEFVTASERVPVAGLPKITFIVQRSGADDVRLPTSMTCFGRLLLPQYSSLEVLRVQLDKAIENCRGFGVA